MINVGADVLVKFDGNQKGKHKMSFIANGGKPTISHEFQPKAYTGKELVGFVGVYYSKELDVNYTLKLEDKSLMLYINDSKTSPVKSIMANLFSNDDYGTFQFTTDNYGNVSFFKLAAGRVKNLKFEKK